MQFKTSIGTHIDEWILREQGAIILYHHKRPRAVVIPVEVWDKVKEIIANQEGDEAK